jgi:arylsulfatase A-like enzyme
MQCFPRVPAFVAVRIRALLTGAALVLFGMPAMAATNVVLIVLDNVALRDIDVMPRTSAYMRANGVEFSNAFVSNSLCAPSRASILTAKYAQNNGVYKHSPPQPYETFYGRGNESSTVGTWFKARGYQTALIGKYMNGYGSSSIVPAVHIPAGWDHWYGWTRPGYYYNYQVNENGSLVAYGAAPEDYVTDRMAGIASRTVATLVANPAPFFLYLGLVAAHEDIESGSGIPLPAPRHAGMFTGATAPRSAAFNEDDVSDKPPRSRTTSPLSADQLAFVDRSYRGRAQALQAADEMIERLIDQLRQSGALANTVIMVMSDNGFFYGEHRFEQGNGQMYEPAARVPLLLSGPGIAKGRRATETMLNIDVFPTLSELAGLDVPTAIDGRSLAAVAAQPLRGVTTGRRSFLQTWSDTAAGIRLPNYAYYETYGGTGSIRSRELYDLHSDPGQTQNIHRYLTSASAARLQRALADFRSCVGAACRQLENSVGDGAVTFSSSPFAAAQSR